MLDIQDENLIKETLGNPTYAEVTLQKPKIAELLDCEIEDVVMLHTATAPGYFGSHKYHDTFLARVPHIGIPSNSVRAHAPNVRYDYGIILYQTLPVDEVEEDDKVVTSYAPPIKYCTYSTINAEYSVSVYGFIAKTNLFRFVRYQNRQNKLYYADNCKAPVLEQGFLDEIVDFTVGFLCSKRKLKKFNVKVKRGVVLSGPPGNGKTMLCRYIQSLGAMHGIGHMSVSAVQIEEGFKNNRLADLLNRDGIIFIDDVDIAYFDRKSSKATIACSLLSAMDGLDQSGNTVRIFTTNENVDAIDPGFLRPGRIDKTFEFNAPTYELRKRFVDSWDNEIVNAIDTETLAEETETMSFAEIDLIKTFMVEKFLVNSQWEMEPALTATRNRLKDIREASKKKVGFA